MRFARTLLLFLAAAVGPVLAAAPTWDTSGNGLLNGTYYFRQVLYVADANGNVSRAFAFYGNIAFSGSGTYAISNATLIDSASGTQAFNFNGTYSVASSGYGFLSSPLVTGTQVYFMVSKGIILGSETESGYNDVFIAAPMNPSLNNASFTGSYSMVGFFPGGNPASAADLYYQLNPNGAGSLGTVSISGYFGGTGATVQTQTSPNVPYTFSNGAAIMTFPTSTTAAFYSGREYLYFSPDTNFVFGGSPAGFDMIVGVKMVTGATPVSGLYYEGGLDEDASQLQAGYAIVDTYYGSFNAYQGSIIGHERLLSAGYSAEGNTYSTTYPTNITGSYKDPSGSVQYTVGANGIRVAVGIGPYLGFSVAIPAPVLTPSGAVYIDPTGIVNTASSAPFTAGVAPGGFLTFYNGVNLAGTTTVASTTPFPTTLGNVQVLIDGIPAPIYYVSSTSVSVIAPYAISTYPIASIQVINNGTPSNVVTAFVNQTTPGAFTSPAGGIGYASMLHGDYSVVTKANPAMPGEQVAVYVTGLGNVFPPNPDGAIGPYAPPLSTTTNTISVYVNGTAVATPLPFAGLAPYLAGLYQINFVVPTGTVAGDATLGIAGPDSYTSESLIPIGTAPVSSARPAAEARRTASGTVAGPAAAQRRRLPRLTRPSAHD
jgi:uncharacterized protein (TIGR03437 family)